MSTIYEPRVVRTENPIREIWSRLSYFESESNAEEYLKKNFPSNDELKIKTSLAFTMKAAREYYQAAESVTILTQPLLVYYGMTALSKVVYIATYGNKMPTRWHGLKSPDDNFALDESGLQLLNESSIFQDLSTKIKESGTFPEFHKCYGKETLTNIAFSLKELFSIIPEVKVEYETVYKEKSKALKVEKNVLGIAVVDSELEKYEDLPSNIRKIPKFNERYGAIQLFGNRASLLCVNYKAKDIVAKTTSGEEYLVLTLNKQNREIVLPEMSAQFIIMYLLSMLCRYPLQQWLEVIRGEKSGEIYIVQKFLNVTKRKFPNLILNELHKRNFTFTNTEIKTENFLR